MNVDIKQGTKPGTLPASIVSLNLFMWIINTSDPLTSINAEIAFHICLFASPLFLDFPLLYLSHTYQQY